MTVVGTYSLFWLVLMLLAIGNGVLREATYGRVMSELRAHQLSTLMAIVVFGLAVLALSRVIVPDSALQAITIGGIWLASTLCFEFFFGHYVAGHSWRRLLRDYDLSSGRVWPLLLFWLTALPFLVYKLRVAVP